MLSVARCGCVVEPSSSFLAPGLDTYSGRRSPTDFQVTYPSSVTCTDLNVIIRLLTNV